MGSDLGNQSLDLFFSHDELVSVPGDLEKLVKDLLKLPNPLVVELREFLCNWVLHSEISHTQPTDNNNNNEGEVVFVRRESVRVVFKVGGGGKGPDGKRRERHGRE
jgi:hypothetical protein